MLFLRIFSLQPRYPLFAGQSLLFVGKAPLAQVFFTRQLWRESGIFVFFSQNARTLKNCFLGVSEVKQIFAPHFSISINFINEESKNSQKYKKFLTVYRQKMALHLVLICPALLAAQDSLGRLVGN